MTKAHSEPGDNDGLCESCNDPATKHQGQSTYPVMLGGGLGRGTMWLCAKCLREHQDRDAKVKLDSEALRARALVHLIEVLSVFPKP